MGVDPITIGLGASALTGIMGAVGQDRANARNARAAQDRYNQLSGLVQGQLQQGPNPYAQMITQAFGPGSQQMAPSTYTPTNAQGVPALNGMDFLSGTGFNTGQDALLQAMRKQLTPSTNPQLDYALQQQASGQNSFDNTALFKALGQQDQYALDQQLAGQRAQAHSLGQLGGTGEALAENNLRAQMTNAAATRNAQIAQSSYESAQSRALQAMGLQSGQQQALNQFNLGAYGAQTGAASQYLQAAMQAAGIAMQPALQNQQLGTQVSLANAGYANQAGQFNAGQANAMQQFQRQLMLQALQGAGGLQAQQTGQNLQGLGILGGMQLPQYQPSALPGALGDVSQMAMLYPFLQQMMGQGAPGSQALGNIAAMPYTLLGSIGQNYPAPAMGWNGFGGGGY